MLSDREQERQIQGRMQKTNDRIINLFDAEE